MPQLTRTAPVDDAATIYGPAERFAEDLRRRLRPVCRDWREAEFEALIQRIATFKMRWRAAGYDA